ncbi:MAG: metallophosphoesterase family protein [Clostridia bacterium]|nr:metallophosphoesterase family protein [Clostridia bacterium]
MRFLIVSDTHGNRRGIEEAVARQTDGLDGIFFLGDGTMDLFRADLPPGLPVYAVRGNCDYPGPDAPPTECLTALLGHTLFLTHGHLFGAKSGIGGLVRAGIERGADLILYGHTHKPLEQYFPAGEKLCGSILQKPLYLFNPGSLKNGSFGFLTLTENTVLFSHGAL